MARSENNRFKGSEIFWTKFSMVYKMWFKIIMAGLIVHLCAIVIYGYFTGPENGLKNSVGFYFSWSLYKTHLFNDAKAYIFFDGQSDWVFIKNVLGDLDLSDLGAVIFTPRALFSIVLKTAVVWLLVIPLALKMFGKISKKKLETAHIRGGKIEKLKTLEKTLKKHNRGQGGGHIPFAGLPLPHELEVYHSFVAGATGTGKTTALLQIIGAIRDRGGKAIIYDYKGDLLSKFYDPDTDHIINPLDERNAKWTITNDVTEKYELNSVARSLIPESWGNERFWNTAAGVTFKALIYSLYVDKKRPPTNQDLYNALILDPAAFLKLLGVSEEGAAVVNRYFSTGTRSGQSGGILATLASYTDWLEYAADQDGDFSVKTWLNQYTGAGSFIFLTGREDIRATLRPFHSLFVDYVGKSLLSMPDDTENRVYFIIDEFGTLNRMDTVKRLLTGGRSKGAAFFIGVQDFAGLKKVYGDEDSITIYNNCANKIVFSVQDHQTAEFFSKTMGDVEEEFATETASMGTDDYRDGFSINRQRQIKRLVLPSEISALPVLHCYVRIGGFPWTKTKVDFTPANHLPERSPPFILRSGTRIETAGEGAGGDTGRIETSPPADEHADRIKDLSEIMNKIDKDGYF